MAASHSCVETGPPANEGGFVNGVWHDTAAYDNSLCRLGRGKDESACGESLLVKKSVWPSSRQMNKLEKETPCQSEFEKFLSHLNEKREKEISVQETDDKDEEDMHVGGGERSVGLDSEVDEGSESHMSVGDAELSQSSLGSVTGDKVEHVTDAGSRSRDRGQSSQTSRTRSCTEKVTVNENSSKIQQVSKNSSSDSFRDENCTCILCDMSRNSYTTSHNSTNSLPQRGQKRRVEAPKVDTVSKKKKISQRTPAPSVLYQSQISPDKNCIKIKIKKSPLTNTDDRSIPGLPKGPKRGGVKRNRKDEKLEVKERKRGSKAKEAAASLSYGAIEDDPEQPWRTRMPIEMLVKVFQTVTDDVGCLPFLVRASKVCRLWRRAAVDPVLWHTIDLARFTKDRHKNEKKLLWLLQNRLGKVQELSLVGWNKAFTPAVIDCIANTCLELRMINFSGVTRLSAENLKFLVKNCMVLAKFDLSGITPLTAIPKSAVSHSCLTEVCRTMGSRLTHLSIANNCMSGLPLVTMALTEHCPNLVMLDISNLRTTTRDIVAINVEKLQKGCPKLEVLRFTNSMMRLSDTSLKDQAASPGFPELEELSIAIDGKGYYMGMDDGSMERILKTSNKLKLLDVRGCGRISHSSLVRVPAWDLQHLFLSGCSATKSSGDGLELILRKWCHSLVEVDLSWTSSSEALNLAVAAIAEAGTHSPLRVLDLCGSSVSFDPLRCLLNRCQDLESLNLTSCRALPRGMKRLYKNNEITNFREALERGKFDEATEEDEDEAEENRGS